MEEEESSKSIVRNSGSVYWNLSVIAADDPDIVEPPVSAEDLPVRYEAENHKTILRIGQEEYYCVKLVIGQESCQESCQQKDDVATLRQFFNQRSNLVHLENPAENLAGDSSVSSSSLGIKMKTLRREMVSLMSQDDCLFQQLLSLHDSISELKSVLTANPSGGTSLSESSSLTSLSTSSDSDNETSGDENGHASGQQNLLRTRISYPPSHRNRVKSIRDSLAWSSSCSSNEEDSCKILEDYRKNIEDFKIPPDSQQPPELIPRAKLKTSSSFSHRRQRSYDSGILGSDPSDAEVFV